MTSPYDDDVAGEALPTLVHVSQAFSSRLPSQRVLDMLTRTEGLEFTELAQNQPGRLLAFRALLRDYPERDTASLWLHAYDVEVEIDDVNPTNGSTPTLSHGSVASGA
jgi:hypothetical protein